MLRSRDGDHAGGHARRSRNVRLAFLFEHLAWLGVWSLVGAGERPTTLNPGPWFDFAGIVLPAVALVALLGFALTMAEAAWADRASRRAAVGGGLAIAVYSAAAFTVAFFTISFDRSFNGEQALGRPVGEWHSAWVYLFVLQTIPLPALVGRLLRRDRRTEGDKW